MNGLFQNSHVKDEAPNDLHVAQSAGARRRQHYQNNRENLVSSIVDDTTEQSLIPPKNNTYTQAQRLKDCQKGRKTSGWQRTLIRVIESNLAREAGRAHDEQKPELTGRREDERLQAAENGSATCREVIHRILEYQKRFSFPNHCI